MKPRLFLIIGDIHPDCGQIIREAGFDVREVSQLDPDLVGESAPFVYGLVIRSHPALSAPLIDKFPNLKVIGRIGAGMENIDVEYARLKGIRCLNSPEGNRDAVGEHAVGMLLSLFNRIPQAWDQIREGIWDRRANRGEEIRGKTIGIVGFGNMGRTFSQKLMGFDCRIIAYDKFQTGFGCNRVLEVDEETLFRETDILSLHVPLTTTTHHMVTAQYIANFAKPIFLINTARGMVVRTSDLIQAIQAGRVQGACLDVIEYEDLGFESATSLFSQPDFRWLCSSDRVILSPHVAGWTRESNQRMAQVLAKKITDILR